MITTINLGAGSGAHLDIPIASGYRVYSITTTRPARIRLFTDAAARNADVNRPVGEDPPVGRGVMLDYVTAAAGTVYPLSPLVDGFTTDSSATVPATVANMDAASGTVGVTIVYVPTEA